MWKMNYRVRVENAAGDATLVAINADYARSIGYTQAVGLCQSFIRRFQSAGINARGDVYGQPRGTNAPGTTAPLSTDAQTEELYAAMDTPNYALRRAISAANTSPTAGDDGDGDVNPEAAGLEA